MAFRILLAMDQAHRTAAKGELQMHNAETTEAPDVRTALQILTANPAFDLVVADGTLPDGTWCSILREMYNAGVNARVLVAADRHDRLLCGDIVARGGYYALAPLHEWKPLENWVGSARKAQSTDDRAATHFAVA